MRPLADIQADLDNAYLRLSTCVRLNDRRTAADDLRRLKREQSEHPDYDVAAVERARGLVA